MAHLIIETGARKKPRRSSPAGFKARNAQRESRVNLPALEEFPEQFLADLHLPPWKADGPSWPPYRPLDITSITPVLRNDPRYSADWAAARRIEDEQKLKEWERLNAEQARKDAEAKKAYEAVLVEADRARRTGVR